MLENTTEQLPTPQSSPPPLAVQKPRIDLAKRLSSSSRLPVLRKVLPTIGTVGGGLASPTTIGDWTIRQQPLVSGSGTSERRIPQPKSNPTISKRQSNPHLNGGSRSISTSGGTTLYTPTTASQAKVTQRKTSQPTLRSRASVSSLQTKVPDTQLSRKVSASALQSPSLPSIKASTTPKGRRTSDVHGTVAPPLNRRASNTALKQSAQIVARKQSNGNLSSGMARIALTPLSDSPTPLRRQSSKDSPKAPQTPTQPRPFVRMPQTAGPRVASRQSKHPPIPKSPESPQKVPGQHRVASQSLRDTIAKARAEHKAAVGKLGGSGGSVDSGNALNGFDFGTGDPFNQAIMGAGGSDKVIQQRAKSARFEGRLNIANLQLKSIPKAVYAMYESTEEDLSSSSGNDDGPKWYESVDLLKIIAADNEIEEFGQQLAEQFGGLQTIDMHNNALSKLPENLASLSQLSTLNLINNKLGNSALTVIARIGCLKDLKLARNQLEGELDECVLSLINLETLELQGNKLTSLPESLGQLTRLRVLNVSSNRLESMPMESLGVCPLHQLDVSSNKLTGTLMPASITLWPTLQTLNIATNRIKTFSASPLSLPSLTQLFATQNALTEAPAFDGWTELLILLIDSNQITILPEELFMLPRLRTLDISGNNIAMLDPRLGVMESLETLKFDGNPLRDRQLAGMSAADVKKTLRGRLAPQISVTDTDIEVQESVAAAVGIISELVTTLTVGRTGLLDLSGKGYEVLEDDVISTIVGSPCALLLSGNKLSTIPVSLGTFASLVSLDLSNNSLGASSYLPARLTLRSLETLTLASSGVTSLIPLFEHLDAPRLNSLDVSMNRLTSIARLRQHLPALTVFLARDNQIEEIPVEDVDGVRTLDLTGNAIKTLPPRLALCTGLRELRVQGNLFKVPRWQVLEKGTDAILAWLRDRLPAGELEGGLVAEGTPVSSP